MNGRRGLSSLTLLLALVGMGDMPLVLEGPPGRDPDPEPEPEPEPLGARRGAARLIQIVPGPVGCFDPSSPPPAQPEPRSDHKKRPTPRPKSQRQRRRTRRRTGKGKR